MASNAANDDVDDRLGVQKQQGEVEEATAAAAAPSAVATALGYSGPKVTATSPAGRRLQKELMTLMKDPPECVTVDKNTLEGNDLTHWCIEMQGPRGTLYEGESFILGFKFGPKYPFDSPEVVFVGDNIPVHPHVYSNGHICLSILTEDWSPALSVQAVCLSIISMLSSAKEKKRPPDNSFYVKTCHRNPKKTRWWYHDDSV